MIDPKELRIGNLVLVHGVKLSEPKTKVLAIDKVVAQSCRNYDPIPITPEWLERLGFVRTRDLIHTAEFVLLGGPCIHILFSKIDGRLYLGESFITRSGDDEDEFIAVPLTFIHQVHNLHFALTGEELTIKQ